MKKSNTKKSKLGSFFSKLNPNSPKKKLLLFVVVFGLIAGGFYAYRSFAATGGGTYRVRDFYTKDGAYTNYNGSSKLPTWTVVNSKGDIWINSSSPEKLSLRINKGNKVCLWGRVLLDSHGQINFWYTGDIKHGLGAVHYSFRQDKSRDQLIACHKNTNREIVQVQPIVKGAIEFTNIQYWQ